MFIGVFKTYIKRYTQKMKHIIFVFLIVSLSLCFSSCGAGNKAGASAEETFDKEASYALGMNVGADLKAGNFYVDVEEFIKGMKDALYGSETRYTMDEAYQVFSEASNALAEQRQLANKQAETDFLAENSKKPGIIVTGSGLQYEVIREGDGEKPVAADTVRVHYEGALTDGTVFDSSYLRGEPVEFPLGGVIVGWTEGLQLMSVGSEYRLIIPSDLGYGPQGAGSQIPPYSTLVFKVELLDIIKDNAL